MRTVVSVVSTSCGLSIDVRCRKQPNKSELTLYVRLCVGGSKGKAGIQIYKKTTSDCGFEFGNNIESINLNLVAGCFLVGWGFWTMGA